MNTLETKDLELTVSRTIAAAREQVFKAWLSPEMLAKFMRPGEGMHVPRAETDPVKGGRLCQVMAIGEREIPQAGADREVDPYSRLAFTWESPFSVDDSVVTIDFDEIDSGSTRVTLRHVKFASEEARNNHEGGWTRILETLSTVLA